MQPGELWCGDFSLPHTLYHAGTKMRTTLLIDVMISDALLRSPLGTAIHATHASMAAERDADGEGRTAKWRRVIEAFGECCFDRSMSPNYVIDGTIPREATRKKPGVSLPAPMSAAQADGPREDPSVLVHAVHNQLLVHLLVCAVLGVFLMSPIIGGHVRERMRRVGIVLVLCAVLAVSNLSANRNDTNLACGNARANRKAQAHAAGGGRWRSVMHAWKRTDEADHLGAVSRANEAYEHHGADGTLWKHYGHPETVYGERNTLMAQMLGRAGARRVFEFAGNGGFLPQAALHEPTCRRSLKVWVHSEFARAALDYAAVLFSSKSLMSDPGGRRLDADAARRDKGAGWHAKLPFTVVHRDGGDGGAVTLTVLDADLMRLDAVRRAIKLHAFDAFATISFEHFANDLRIIHMMPAGAQFVFSAAQFDNPDHARFFPTESDLRARYAAWLEFAEVACVRCAKGRGKWVVRARVRPRVSACADRSLLPPVCAACIPGLVSHAFGGCDMTEHARYVRAGLEQLAKVLLGSKAALGPPLRCSEPSFLPLGWDYLDSQELKSRQALIAHWMTRSQPQRILDIGAFTSPIYKHMLHCPSEARAGGVVIVEPCAELSMPGYHHGVRQEAPWYSRMRPCPNPDDGDYLLTVVAATIQEYLTLQPRLPFDAVICVGCEGGKVNESIELGRQQQSKDLKWRAGIAREHLTRRFVRPFDLFIGFAKRNDASRLQFSMLPEDDAASAQAMLDENCSLLSLSRLNFPTIANTHGAQRLVHHVRCSVDPVPLSAPFIPPCSASGFLVRSIAVPDLCVSSASRDRHRHGANLSFAPCQSAADALLTFKLAPSPVAQSFFLLSATEDLCVIGSPFDDRHTAFSGDSRLNMNLHFRYGCKLKCCRGALPYFELVNAGRGKFYLRASGLQQQYPYHVTPRKNGRPITEGKMVDLFRRGPNEHAQLGDDVAQLQFQMIDPATRAPCAA